ncbi:putative F-box associated domain, type 1 [Rosa chinensis]|uniref:Putative F-box associated domain, type 1 n=1 Tax=Rosa chinensis TaxID=74649 RepID=A0A2P6S114_ROSCH|nr:putative F-box associated domain, type 1 [Rosa chinensis]
MVGAGCSVNEALHWVLREQEDGRFIDSSIVSFDLAEEKFHEILFPYPPNPVDSHELFAGVGILNNCLTLAFQTMCGRLGCNFKMWVMKDYGVKESWSEVINIPSGIAKDEYVFFTCISENGEVLVQLNLLGSLELYNPKGKTFRTLLDYSGHWYGAATYIETLVSPLMGSTGAIM